MPCGIVEYFGPNESVCGYCKSTDKTSRGMWAHVLTVEEYQHLLDRGWRRSGKYCYKPDLSKTCCCLYTIRCDATAFKLRKSQKRVLKRMNHFLLTGEKRRFSADLKSIARTTDDVCELNEHRKIDVKPSFNLDDKVDGETTNQEKSELNLHREQSAEYHHGFEKLTATNTVAEHNLLKHPNKAKCKRRLRKLQKLASKGLNPVLEKREPHVKSVEEFLYALNNVSAHKLDVRLVRSHPAEQLFQMTLNESFNVYKKYQIAVHKDEEDELSMKRFQRFLCDSPLLAKEESDTRSIFGSFHQQYLLDEKIIAVGVIDILPHCVSSKYFFYDPNYAFLDLGVYSALREITLVRSLNKQDYRIKYYYLGYYLNNNAKMKYKAQYQPSYLLCPEAFTWHPIEKCLPLLEVSKYSRLEPDFDEKDPDEDMDLNQVGILHQTGRTMYGMYKMKPQIKKDEQENALIKQYAGLVGKSAYSMLLYRDRSF